MKFLIAIILFLCANLLFAQQKRQAVEVSFYGAYAFADLNWSIAGNAAGQSPNVLSEVKWEELSGPSVDAQLKIYFTPRWFISGRFSKSFVKSGSVTDSDYAQDNRQERTYHAELRSNEGSFIDFNASAGYHFFNRDKLSLGLLAGYKGSREQLFLLNNTQPSIGEKNLRSTYQTSWKGISTGLFADYQFASKVIVNANLIYSQLKYNAKADWNLIDAFKHPVSFTHDAEGYDIRTSMTLAYQVTNRFLLELGGEFSYSATGTGIDRLFLESGIIQTTQFNGATKSVKSMRTGCVFRF